MGNEGHLDVLWKLVVSRDKTLAGAHRLSEIRLLEKEEEIAEKEAEIQQLKREAEGRMEVIHQLKQSYYYRLGYALLYLPLALRKLFRFRGK